MNWQFEWNWLGYVWAILIGGMLLVMALRVIGEVARLLKTGRIPLHEDQLIGSMGKGIMFFSVLLGLLTAFVWNLVTVLWLMGGSWGLVGLIAWIYVGMRWTVYRVQRMGRN